MDYSKIGTQLKLVRERKGLSHHQVFEITRIQPYILKGIEEGTVNMAPVFLRSFIKTYCQFLGLDFEKLTQDLIEETQDKENSVYGNNLNKTSAGKQKKNVKNLFKYIIPVVVVLAFFSFINFFKLPTKLFTKASKQMNISKTLTPNLADEEMTGETELSTFEEEIVMDTELSENEKEEPALLDESLFGQLKSLVFKHEILIQSSQNLNIYFKTDNRFTINKSLSPLVWFLIKAEESIYLRFDEKLGEIQMFYNGEQVDLGPNRFFERKFE